MTLWSQAPDAMRFLWLGFLFGYVSLASADEPSSLAVLQSMQSALTGAIDQAGKSIVAVARVQKDSGRNVADSLNFNLPGMGKPLIDPTSPRFVPTEFASGVIVSTDGDVLTTYHVLGDPDDNEYYIWHQGSGHQAVVKAVPAQVQAGDPWTDMAVLKFSGINLKPIEMGDASEVQRGEFVIALGNPYAVARDGRASASLGIVSNLQRSAARRRSETSHAQGIAKEQLHEYGTLIQTDAKLNLGTSGGALINLQGEMIGLTSALASVAGYDQAAGFAIPIDESSKATIRQLQSGRTPSFGFLGLEPTDVQQAARQRGIQGAVVRQVVRGMPAERAGIRSGDLITEVDGLKIDGAMQLFREMSRRPAHAHVQLTVLSGNPIIDDYQTRSVEVTLGKKHLALAKPAYSRHPEPSWRGMKVDHGSALPPAAMFGFSRPRQILPVAVTSVDPDTPAWTAGIRPGQFIESIDGTPAIDPDIFYKSMEKKIGPVELRILGAGNRSRRVTVLPAE